MDRIIFTENFTENEEIKEQILFYRAMRNAKKKYILTTEQMNQICFIKVLHSI
jgi:hypothetical protein